MYTREAATYVSEDLLLGEPKHGPAVVVKDCIFASIERALSDASVRPCVIALDGDAPPLAVERKIQTKSAMTDNHRMLGHHWDSGALQCFCHEFLGWRNSKKLQNIPNAPKTPMRGKPEAYAARGGIANWRPQLLNPPDANTPIGICGSRMIGFVRQ